MNKLQNKLNNLRAIDLANSKTNTAREKQLKLLKPQLAKYTLELIKLQNKYTELLNTIEQERKDCSITFLQSYYKKADTTKLDILVQEKKQLQIKIIEAKDCVDTYTAYVSKASIKAHNYIAEIKEVKKQIANTPTKPTKSAQIKVTTKVAAARAELEETIRLNEIEAKQLEADRVASNLKLDRLKLQVDTETEQAELLKEIAIIVEQQLFYKQQIQIAKYKLHKLDTQDNRMKPTIKERTRITPLELKEREWWAQLQ